MMSLLFYLHLWTRWNIPVNGKRFFNGWLSEFTDSDVASLICPRPLLVQAGKADRIALWPQIVEEFGVSKQHYEKLDIADRIEMDLHDGGHEIRLESGIEFLKKWLQR